MGQQVFSTRLAIDCGNLDWNLATLDTELGPTFLLYPTF